ncbi:hypothetical protein L1887_11123 [Cichorium endivia]|nr:hypothetical protein L1887_11123 [Cichorium endivia]
MTCALPIEILPKSDSRWTDSAIHCFICMFCSGTKEKESGNNNSKMAARRCAVLSFPIPCTLAASIPLKENCFLQHLHLETKYSCVSSSQSTLSHI